MYEILVPKYALSSEEAFREWSLKTCKLLWPNNKIEVAKIPLINPESVKKYFDIILEYVSFVYANGLNPKAVPNFNMKPISKKLNSSTIDLVSIVCEVLVSNFNVSLSMLAKVLGKTHATIIYYRKRHRNYFDHVKGYKDKYIKLINLLQNEGIIRVTPPSQSNSQRVLCTTLPESEHTILHASCP